MKNNTSFKIFFHIYCMILTFFVFSLFFQKIFWYLSVSSFDEFSIWHTFLFLFIIIFFLSIWYFIWNFLYKKYLKDIKEIDFIFSYFFICSLFLLFFNTLFLCIDIHFSRTFELKIISEHFIYFFNYTWLDFLWVRRYNDSILYKFFSFPLFLSTFIFSFWKNQNCKALTIWFLLFYSIFLNLVFFVVPKLFNI